MQKHLHVPKQLYNYWFKPNVGMVKMDFNHYVLNPRTFRTWDLKKILFTLMVYSDCQI